MQVYLKVTSKFYRNLLLSSIIKDHPNEITNTLERENRFIYIGFL